MPTYQNYAAFHGFKIGALNAMALRDGRMFFPYDGLLSNAEPAELARLQAEHAIPADLVPLDLTAILVDLGDRRVLVDPGMGLWSDMFGPGLGQTAASLRSAGVDPAEVTDILLTHLHPDHCWGLRAPDGTAVYPNARLHVSRTDHDEWANPPAPELSDFRAVWTRGNIEAIAPYTDRTEFFAPGDRLFGAVEVLPVAGHSNGMCAFRIESDGQSLLLTGDTLHHHVFDVRHPEWLFSIDYDADAAQGARAKAFILDEAATGDTMLHKFHFPFPGLGRIERLDTGFRFAPVGVSAG